MSTNVCFRKHARAALQKDSGTAKEILNLQCLPVGPAVITANVSRTAGRALNTNRHSGVRENRMALLIDAALFAYLSHRLKGTLFV